MLVIVDHQLQPPISSPGMYFVLRTYLRWATVVLCRKVSQVGSLGRVQSPAVAEARVWRLCFDVGASARQPRASCHRISDCPFHTESMWSYFVGSSVSTSPIGIGVMVA